MEQWWIFKRTLFYEFLQLVYVIVVYVCRRACKLVQKISWYCNYLTWHLCITFTLSLFNYLTVLVLKIFEHRFKNKLTLFSVRRFEIQKKNFFYETFLNTFTYFLSKLLIIWKKFELDFSETSFWMYNIISKLSTEL